MTTCFTVTVSRDLPVAPEVAFDRWTDPADRARFETPEGSGMRHEGYDTRADGTETVLIEIDGQEIGRMIDEIRVIERPHRLLVQGRGVFGGAVAMLMQTVVEIEATQAGSRMTGTSQIATLGEHPTEAEVSGGWEEMFDRFAALLIEESDRP